ncbi:hypothetical protein SeLEV6574_g05521 [Synchytrium endobioticum]|uniref:Pericentrin/AKAP-450 centrosomal targeting domain-containing protein n=1 Tax=Synchytrium endobioticum TaxID=286115 RepID=A0A507CTY4_9FUNG|nr:hypothetical protein SeLEV6574_g05521 [Synchytrium endobioticum]
MAPAGRTSQASSQGRMERQQESKLAAARAKLQKLQRTREATPLPQGENHNNPVELHRGQSIHPSASRIPVITAKSRSTSTHSFIMRPVSDSHLLRKIAQLEADVQASAEENEALERRLVAEDRLLQRAETAEAQLENAQKAAKSHEEQGIKYYEELENKRLRIRTLEDDNAFLVHTQKNLEEKLQTQKEAIDQINASTLPFQESLDAAQTENARLRDQVQSLQGQIDTLSAEGTQLASWVGEGLSMCETLLSERDVLAETVSLLRKEKENAVAQHDELRSVHEALQETLVVKTQAMNKITAEVEVYRDMAKLESQSVLDEEEDDVSLAHDEELSIDEKDSEIATLSNTLDVILRQLKSEISDHANVLSKLDDVVKDRRHWESQCHQVTVEKGVIGKKYAELKTAADECRKQLDKAEQLRECLEEALLVKTDEYDEIVMRQQHSIRDLESQLENANNDRYRAHKQVTDYRNILEELSQHLLSIPQEEPVHSHQTNELHEATEKVKLLSKELDAKKLESKEHISTISRLRSELKYSAEKLERWQLFSAENGDIDTRLMSARHQVESHAQMAYSAMESLEVYRNELTRKQIQMQEMESEINLLYKDRCRRDTGEFLLIDINEDMTPEPIGPLIDSNEANQKGSCKTARNLPESELSGMSQLTDDTEIKLTDLPETQHCALDISACRINLEDFAELHAKASQAANYCMLFKSSQSVLRDQESEIQVLKSAIEVMTARPVEGVASTELLALKWLQKQVEEIRNVFRHESMANSVLRGLIVKTQQEAMAAADDAQAREKQLRAELSAALSSTASADSKRFDVKDVRLQQLEEMANSKPKSPPLSEPDTSSKDRDVHLSRITDLEMAQEVLSSEVKEIADARDNALAHVEQLVEELAHERNSWKAERKLLESELSNMRQLQEETEQKAINFQETQHRHYSTMETEAEQKQVEAVSKLSRDHTTHSEAVSREHNQIVSSLQHQIQKLEKMLETTTAAKKSLERGLADKDRFTTEAMVEFERSFKLKESAWLYEKQGLEERILKAKDAWAAERLALIKEAEVSKGAADLASRRIGDTLRERDIAQRALTIQVETAAATLNAGIRAHEAELAASHMEKATLPLEQELTLQQLTISDAARRTERERTKLLAAKYKNLKTDHQRLRDDCRLMLQELSHMRAYVARLSKWRNDLGYQKSYLEMARINLIESHKTSLDLIQGMGVASPEVPRSLTPTRKFRRCARVVIVCMRMK